MGFPCVPFRQRTPVDEFVGREAGKERMDGEGEYIQGRRAAAEVPGPHLCQDPITGLRTTIMNCWEIVWGKDV